MGRFLAVFGGNIAIATATGVSLSFCMLSATGSSLWLAINMGVYYTSALFSARVGKYVDRFSTRNVFLCSNLLRTVLLSCYWWVLGTGLAFRIAVLLSLSFLIGLAKLPQTPVFRKTFTALIPTNGHTRASGYYGAVANSSALSGMLLAGIAIDRVSARATLGFLTIVFGLFTAAIVLIPNVQPARKGVGHVGVEPEGARKVFDEVSAGRYLIFALMGSVFACAPIESVLPGALTAWGLGSSSYTVALASFTLGSVAGGALVGRLLRNRDLRRFLTLSVLGLGAGVSAIALTGPQLYWALVALAFLVGLVLCMVESAVFGIFHEKVPMGRQGSFFSQIGGMQTLVEASGFMLAGYLADRFNARMPFLVFGILVTILIVFPGYSVPSNLRPQAQWIETK